MNLVKYIFSKKHRESLNENYSKELVERYNMEVDKIESIYANIEFERLCKTA